MDADEGCRWRSIPFMGRQSGLIYFSYNSLKRENECCGGVCFSRELIQLKKNPNTCLGRSIFLFLTKAFEGYTTLQPFLKAL